MNQLQAQYPVRLICRVLGGRRSRYYYRAHAPADETLPAALVRLAGDWLKPKKRRKTRPTTDSRHAFPRYPNLVAARRVERPDQVWVADITYIRLQREFVYLAVLMDVFTRQIRGWHLSRELDHIT